LSRVGNSPISVPKEVSINIQGENISVSGPKGNLDFTFNSNIIVENNDNKIIVSRKFDSAQNRALHGTTRQMINNLVQGVNQGFSKKLELIGVGYQASMEGKRLKLQLGYSHDIFFDTPDEITITVEKNILKVEGINKQLVGAVAAKIRSFRKPEPYKGKGVRYIDEYVKIKQGKTVGGAQ
tara:strand:+ start:785 stop:1327 length:543 start_codon:yes stop_codon:yes gene_type:complete